ncbi:MAG: DUF4386 domain-containing protein [Gemmatimonadaceae bacterium]|nr:DUF4386 domain-containing protein [Gemmatimonadaceae bacterium]
MPHAETVPPDTIAAIRRTARLTGLCYLGLAVTGVFGFLLIRARLYVAADAAATLANLSTHTVLARAGIGMEMGIVLAQSLAAVWFYRLFRSIDTFAAGTLAAFGLINAIAILGSAALLASALAVAGNATLAAGGDAAATVQLLYVVSGNLWGVGAIFFGLWLIPMGWLVLHSGWMPRALGHVLMVGGVGYVLNAFVGQTVPGIGAVADALTIPASVGEFWMIGYLLWFGVRERPSGRADGRN